MALPEPPLLRKTMSDGGIPVYEASDVTLIDKPTMNFDGIPPEFDRLWYGAINFDIGGESWKLNEFIAYGAEGQTYLATQQSTGKKFAAKFCLMQDSREIELLKRLPRQLVTHPNFLTYESMALNVQKHFAPAHHIIFMENVPNGELFELLASQEASVSGKPVTEGTMRRFLHDVIRGMAECYRFGITHRDLKPENLLINEEGTIVIIDLGHAKKGEVAPCLTRTQTDGGSEAPPMQPLLRTSTVNAYGTQAFNAPEVDSGMKYDCELSDIWSVGVIAFYLHGKLPAFKVAGGAGAWEDIMGTANEPFWRKIKSSGWYPTFPDELTQFINVLWQTTPSKRPSFTQLELALTNDVDTIAQFPGLQWLAQPVNDPATFIGELRRSCPSKTFRLPGEGAAKAAPPGVATRW